VHGSSPQREFTSGLRYRSNGSGLWRIGPDESALSDAAEPCSIKQMCPDTLKWSHGSGHRTSAQRLTMSVHESVGAARDLRF
jgi:hypothetical protein